MFYFILLVYFLFQRQNKHQQCSQFLFPVQLLLVVNFKLYLLVYVIVFYNNVASFLYSVGVFPVCLLKNLVIVAKSGK